MRRLIFILALLISFNSFSQSTEEYTERGYVKFENKDYYGAVADFTKALEVGERFFREVEKMYLQGSVNKEFFDTMRDRRGRINYSRGIAKYYIGDKKGACQDMFNAYKLGVEGASSFINSECI